MDHDFSQSEDLAPTALADQVAFSDYERKQLRQLAQQADQLHGLAHDAKAARAHQMLVEKLPNDNAIVFCRYIPTANYLGELLRESLAKPFRNDLVVAIITSELSDEERKAKVLEVQDDPRSHKLIVATDCMSEGINLQKAFSAVIHYDLPWNPNRLEQREGRVDRFGQPKKEVHTLMLYGKDNPMDGTVLKVLLRKAQEIRKAIGISVPFPDDSRSIMDAVLNAVLLKPQPQADQTIQGQLHFGQDDAVQQLEKQVEASFERIKEREQQITSVFAQHEIQPEELLPYLYETDAVLGNESTVAQFVAEALPLLGCTLQTTSTGHRLNTTHLPGDLRPLLPQGTQVKLAFQSPPPEGQHYVGRNHPFVDRLCQKLLEAALVRDPELFLARGAVICTDQVQTRTTLYLLRVRNVIASRQHQHDLVAEEMLLWGFTGPVGDHQPETHAFHLLDELRPTQQVPEQEKEQELQNALADYHRLRPEMEALARLRAAHMVEGHKRFHQLLDRNQFREVEPVLPPDVLGVYVILPE
ncbi:MAG: helicase-related protein [Bacteroidota bacterium]